MTQGMSVELSSKFMYFGRIEVCNLKCFGSKQYLDLTDGSGNPTRWNLILGENGFGKTTLLEFLALMLPEPANDDAFLIRRSADGSEMRYESVPPLGKGEEESEAANDQTDELPGAILVPTIQNVDDNTFFEKVARLKTEDLGIWTEFIPGPLVEFCKERDDAGQTEHEVWDKEVVITGFRSSYDENGGLKELFRQGSKAYDDRNEIDKQFSPPFVVVYGANRHMGKENKKSSPLEDSVSGRLAETELYDVEEILIDLDHAAARSAYKGEANDRFENFKRVVSEILPDVEPSDIRVNPRESKEFPGVTVRTDLGQVAFDTMSLGYQTTSALALDLAWRLDKQYPESTDLLNEPAIVFIDEFDLHLHPKWQLRIMDDLRRIFGRVQFIATSHSPLLVQASGDTNFAVMEKGDGEVIINNDPHVVRTWRVDQILNSELFGLKSSRDRKTEMLIEEKYHLVDLDERTPEQKLRLEQINEEILALPTLSEEASASDLISKAAEILKKYGVELDDTDR